jgi:tellurite methyltransferase
MKHSTADPTRTSAAELQDLWRRPSAEACLIDLRGRRAHLRAHPQGAVSIPAARLLDSLFLLPPRHRRLILAAGPGTKAQRTAHGLARELRLRGWTKVGWLEGSILDLDRDLLAAGEEPNRLWEPAVWLRRQEPHLPREGPAVDLACGSGRNTVFLALGGRQVLGVDLLPEALRHARSLARAAIVPPPGSAVFRRADLRRVEAAEGLLPAGRCTLVICFRYLQRSLLPLMSRALAPGGWIVYETFLTQQAESGRKPRSPAHLLHPGELLQAFSDLEIMEYREAEDDRGDWMASLAARKPGGSRS